MIVTAPYNRTRTSSARRFNSWLSTLASGGVAFRQELPKRVQRRRQMEITFLAAPWALPFAAMSRAFAFERRTMNDAPTGP